MTVSELSVYLLKHKCLQGPLIITEFIIGIEWKDPVILPEEIREIIKSTGQNVYFIMTDDMLAITFLKRLCTK